MYVHNAHNLVFGSLFLADHKFLGALYEQLDGYYDSVVERMIGLGKPVDLVQYHENAVQMLKQLPAQVKENKEYFRIILSQLDSLTTLLEQECKAPGITEGTKQLLGGIADQLEMTKYKIRQRIK